MIDAGIFALLYGEVEEAKRKYAEAKDKFWHIAAKPFSDLISTAVREETFARQAYIDAMARLNRYLQYGEIPDDVVLKLGRKAKSAGMA
jgi:hypothetical protein